MRTDGLKKLEPQELDEEDDDAEAPISHQCVDCRAQSPPTRTQHTLSSVGVEVDPRDALFEC
ncbi:MAG: hypothetical protein IPM79_23120 [Polyangiaceae bacterium]|nr:hypothetical protein [Polyangiaceae bacterium]